MSEIIRVFEIFGNRFEVTKEFGIYNEVRSEQERKVCSINVRRANAVDQCNADFKRIVTPALKEFMTLINNRINTPLEVASLGFTELKHCQNEVLARIGKRLIFKYTKNELISVAEVARHIELDAAKYFSGFMNEMQQIDDRKQSYLVSQEYKSLMRSAPTIGGIGLGVSGMAGVAAGTLAANAGLGILHGIGDMIGQGISNAIASKDTAKSVVNAKQMLYNAFIDIANQVGALCIITLDKEIDAELNAIGRKPFKELSEEHVHKMKAKWENYDKAYKQGDITPEKYVTHIFTMIEDTPHNTTLYHSLYKVAIDVNDDYAKKAIIEFANYLGLEGQMESWMIQEGYALLTPKFADAVKDKPDPMKAVSSDASTAASPKYDDFIPKTVKHLNIVDERDLSFTAESTNTMQEAFQQHAEIIHCMGIRSFAQKDPRQALRTIGLRPNGTIAVTGDKTTCSYTDTIGWRNITAVCSISIWIVGLRADGTIVVSGMKEDNKVYKTITNWRDITAISCGLYHVLGLKKNGTVVAVVFETANKNQCDVENWRDIVAISAGFYHSVGLKSDGTVVAVGKNDSGQCNVSGWRNIAAISARGLTMGLTKDGRAIISRADNPNGIPSGNPGNNIIAISVGSGFESHALELRSDGTVTALGGNSAGQCNVSKWNNIIAIAAGDGYSVGVKSDGTVITAGKNEYRETDVVDWNIGPYSPELAAKTPSADEQRAEWKAAGLCPVCGGTRSRFLKTCNSCGA